MTRYRAEVYHTDYATRDQIEAGFEAAFRDELMFSDIAEVTDAAPEEVDTTGMVEIIDDDLARQVKDTLEDHLWIEIERHGWVATLTEDEDDE